MDAARRMRILSAEFSAASDIGGGYEISQSKPSEQREFNDGKVPILRNVNDVCLTSSAWITMAPVLIFAPFKKIT